ncbi:MAG TPA: acetyl-CoA carboxylase biotin carboxylase subunit [Ignavibacteria bacterium]|nr:acetyl-CoA carboxylase biotin carboxylase subunit [Ignavibacteria bacterium]
MFKKILIANRGEIAVRVINTAREMGIKSVAVYSDFDKNSLNVRLADEAFHIGESPASKSYLLADKIIDVAKKSGAEAIHPGYGFLSERSYFAEMCEKSGIKFIGPSSKAIDFLGSKTNAKKIAVDAKVPIVPGTVTPLKDFNEANDIAKKIGYPVLIKASAGGGGKGMRIVQSEDELESMFRMAQNEARSSFGDDSVFIEKYILAPRHVEFQILADEHGNVIHLGERECSMQRRLQKVIEETPSTIIDDELRKKMGDCAVQLAKEANYSNAGTIEFIVDKNKNFYFLEMNTRLQVEHPITEMRTGIDLVKEQLKVAYGEKLSFKQEDIKFKGHSIECRISAEDPDNNFIPSTGKITYLSRLLGNGLREDTGIEQGDEVSVYYDSMIAKLVSYADTREQAIEKMKRGLESYLLDGIKTNISFLYSLLECPEFINGGYDTQFIEKTFLERYKNSTKDKFDNEDAEAAAFVAVLMQRESKNDVANNNSVLKQTSKWKEQNLKYYR